MASISWSDRGWTARKSQHWARYKTGSGWSCALTKVGKVDLRRSVLFHVCCTKGSVVEVAWGKGVVWVKGGVWSKGAGVVRGLVWGGKGLYMQEDVFQLLVQVIYPDVLLTVFLWDMCLNGPRWCFFQSFVIPTPTISDLSLILPQLKLETLNKSLNKIAPWCKTSTASTTRLWLLW